MEAKFTKIDLKNAFEAGQKAVKFNKDRDDLLEAGTKQCPAEMTFDTWFECNDEKQPPHIGFKGSHYLTGNVG